MPSRPLIIGHRGACGVLPEHTLAAYDLALRQGADATETDILPTRDRKLVCRHDVELSSTTNVADLAEFADRKTSRSVDGVVQHGWFVEDFTLDELQRLRARQRFAFRDHSNDDRWTVPTLDELLDLTATRATAGGVPPGVIIEIKHPTRFAAIGLPVETLLVELVRRRGLDRPDAPIWLESFEPGILKSLRRIVRTPIIQLMDSAVQSPADSVARGQSVTFADLTTPAGLAGIAAYAGGIGAWKGLIIPDVEESGLPGRPTTLVADAHAAGLTVHAWTFRSEASFLSEAYERDPSREYARFVELGIDGVITDFPADAVAALHTLD